MRCFFITEQQQLYMTEPDILSPDPTLTAEEAIRQWWQHRFDQPLPDDARQWMRTLIKQEVQKARRAEHVLDDTQLNKVREGRRLCQTKLAMLEEAMRRLLKQREQLRQFVTINAEMSQQRARLYEINKQQSAQLQMKHELERFETFESVNGLFQRINTLTAIVNRARQEASRLAITTDDNRRAVEKAERQLVVEEQKTQEAINAVAAAARVMTEAERLATTVSTTAIHRAIMEQQLKQLQERQEMLTKQQQEALFATDHQQTEMDDLRLRQQALLAHRQLIERGAGVQISLDELQEAMTLRNEINAQLDHALRQQNERDEQMSHLFTQHQQLTAYIQSLQEEIAGHRRSIAGQDSYNMQRRALELKSKRLMLETGFSLWRTIAAGYDQIEQKEQLMAQLRLQADQLNRTIDTLTEEVRQLTRQLEQRTFHLTLSKSQNVIELRGSLEEGQACTVCGATHHPWQSDTVTEQNALIASLKSDCETLGQHLATKQQALHEAQMALTAAQGKFEVETVNLDLLIARQRKDTEEWQTFAKLDRSFIECSRSTNREARTAMIRQLIEKTTVDAETAERDLNTFTFHLDAISQLGVQLQQLQQEETELTTRLNEVNTACQANAGHVQRLEQRLKTATQNYSRRYAALGHLITIPEWFKTWTASPEALKLQIQGMMDQWADITEDMHRHEVRLQELKTETTQVNKTIEQVILDITQLEARVAQAGDIISKAQDTLDKLLPQTTGKDFFAAAEEHLAAQQQVTAQARQHYQDDLQRQLSVEAQIRHLEEATHQTEDIMAADKKELDLWMRHYNADNPPVQFTELQRVLADGKDWTDTRDTIRDTTIKQAVVQARVEHLRAQIIALQAEGLRVTSTDGAAEQTSMQQQQEDLETQYKAILQQQAHYDELLKAHEQLCKS
ncbi:MAG: hypothetical protein IJT75_00070 [Bacteroidaceae bacterium]|nr:hypothetical protein [Bacteroidaceae bacterium]